MATLQFHREISKISLHARDGSEIGTWDAANNVDSRCKGPWPDGQYTFAYYLPHPGDPPSSAYGAHGIFIFDVPNREAMGVHSGREGVPDGLGHEGFLHCTMGCVRTTDDAMAQFVRTHNIDSITEITIEG